MDVGDIREFVYRWNSKFSIDRWWRQKHGVAFNSPQHQEMNFIDMRIEYEEDLLYREMRDKSKKKDKGKEDVYIPGSGKFLKSKQNNYSQEEIDDAFDKF